MACRFVFGGDMQIEALLQKEITAINRLLSEHGVDAGTTVEHTVIAGGSFVAYGLLLGRGVSIAAISRLLGELQEVLTAGRGVPVPVRLRYMPLALEVPHPAPYPLHWKRARFGDLQPGQMLAGRSFGSLAANEVIDLAASPHVLVAGITGSGKSVLANMLILSLALVTPPDDLDMWVIDLKAEDMLDLAGLPHVSQVATNRQDAADMIRRLHALKDQRVAQGRGDFRRTLLVIDELAELAQVPGCLDLLGSIVSIGRSKRINVVACTQKPTAAVVGSIAKANFTTRLVGRVSDAAEAATATGRRDTGAECLRGAGAFLRVEGQDTTRLQAYLMDKAGIDYLIAWVRVTWGDQAAAMHRKPRQEVQPAAALPVRLPGLAVGASAPVTRAPAAAAVGVPAAVAAVFAQFAGADGTLQRGGVAAALRAIHGPGAPTSGRAFQEARAEVEAMFAAWRLAVTDAG